MFDSSANAYYLKDTCLVTRDPLGQRWIVRNDLSSSQALEFDGSLYIANGAQVLKMTTAGVDATSWTSAALGCDVRALALDGSGLLHMGAQGTSGLEAWFIT